MYYYNKRQVDFFKQKSAWRLYYLKIKKVENYSLAKAISFQPTSFIDQAKSSISNNHP